MKKLLYWIDHYLEEAILVIFLILIACVMMLQIVVRYVFQSPLPWPEEFCRYCFVYSVMIATGYCIRNGSMLRVDVVINLFPRGIAFALDIFSKILATVFCFIMLKAAYNVMYTAYDIQQTSPAMQMPIWILYSSAPLGFLLGGVRGIQGIILSFIEYRKNHRKPKNIWRKRRNRKEEKNNGCCYFCFIFYTSYISSADCDGDGILHDSSGAD